MDSAIAAGPVNELARQCYHSACRNGWDVTRYGDWAENFAVNKLAAKIALMHSELSEALEALRAGDEENGREEIADCLIRIFDFVGGLGWDMDAEIQRKLEINKSRGFRHGNKRL